MSKQTTGEKMTERLTREQVRQGVPTDKAQSKAAEMVRKTERRIREEK